MKDMQDLVIVESPTKARTLLKFLGNKFQIDASMGHIRDLPKSKLGINIEANFEPEYIIPRDKRKKVNELKKLAKGAKQLWLATDPDREGEAIAAHIAYILKNPERKTDTNILDKSVQIKRVVFHEITEEAIKEAFAHPREIDTKLVNAQTARRVLDRLVGYKLSPLLWQKIKRGLSAGRVQSVALKLIVEREREILIFKPVEYWSIEVDVEKSNQKRFFVTLIEDNGKKVVINNKALADEYVKRLDFSSYNVSKITQKQVKRHPAPPFITSTLQQTAGNKLGFTAKKTMMLAQNLYEHGFITYMRTDSVNLSTQALTGARDFISQNFGKNYLPAIPRIFKSKSKNAQEAHEAIRPSNLKLTSEQVNAQGFNRDHKRLYDLIWKRTIASQMTEAILDQTTVDVLASQSLSLRATGSVLKFDGWLKLYGVTQSLEEESAEDSENKKQVLPELSEGEDLNKLNILPSQHFSEPPPRYTESSLIKKLEELGIGRPSTYAPIISTIQERLYVERSERKFTPTALGFTVNDFLMKFFPELFDYNFTASMEDALDDISRGERVWQDTIRSFFLPFEKKLEETQMVAEKVKLEVEVSDKLCPTCGKNLIVRTGRFGKFLACSGFPECKYTESLDEIINAKCPEDQGEIVVRRTKRGKVFYGCKNYPKCKYASWSKPKVEIQITQTASST
ncbi:type I DNA topoisomerase [Candidatus Daviesbacteria bacterium]|nr:type I DNA topoisomerase [Candidatus Daviesbacteria bacterium]